MTEKNKGGHPVYWTPERQEKLCDDFEVWIEDPMHFWFKDFVYEQRMHMDTWYKIAETNTRLKGIIKKAKLKQENCLVKGGLLNKLNAGFTKFILHAIHSDEYCVQEDNNKSVTINLESKSFSAEEEDG